MKKVAGLIVASGLLLTASYSFGKPPAKGTTPAASNTRSKSTGAPAQNKPETVAAPAPSELVWAAADRDGDGSVSFGEFADVVNASIARRVETRFKQLDRNHDGRCSRAEVNKMIGGRFARFDLNRDGAFTAAELARVMQAELAGRMQALYVRLDQDKNGTFSVAELTPPAPQPASQPRKTRVVATRGPSSVQ
jgi:Ca2+-binding EF-hand superfamily protein